MTKNQIEYWRNVETKRNNLITEIETKRANQAKEAETLANNLRQIEELKRHNREMELLTRQAQDETARRNLEQERLALLTHYENQRSNQANEQIATQRNAINSQQISLGYSQLGETIQHNRAQESTNLLSASTAEARQIEDARHNKQSEYDNLLISGDKIITERLRIRQQAKAAQQAVEAQKYATNLGLLGSLANAAGRYLASVFPKKSKVH